MFWFWRHHHYPNCSIISTALSLYKHQHYHSNNILALLSLPSHPSLSPFFLFPCRRISTPFSCSLPVVSQAMCWGSVLRGTTFLHVPVRTPTSFCWLVMMWMKWLCLGWVCEGVGWSVHVCVCEGCGVWGCQLRCVCERGWSVRARMCGICGWCVKSLVCKSVDVYRCGCDLFSLVDVVGKWMRCGYVFSAWIVCCENTGMHTVCVQ